MKITQNINPQVHGFHETHKGIVSVVDSACVIISGQTILCHEDRNATGQIRGSLHTDPIISSCVLEEESLALIGVIASFLLTAKHGMKSLSSSTRYSVHHHLRPRSHPNLFAQVAKRLDIVMSIDAGLEHK